MYGRVTGVTVVGVRGPINTPGWASPTGLYLDDVFKGFGFSAEVSTALHAIMAVGNRGRLEFLG